MTAGSGSLALTAPLDPERRLSLYRALAEALVAIERPAGVLFESSTERPLPRVTVRPASLVGPWLARPSAPPLRPVDADPPVGTVKPENGREEVHLYRPVGVSPTGFRALGPWEAPLPEASLGAGGRLEFQTFWLARRDDGRIWVARRSRFTHPSADELAARAPSVRTLGAAEWSRATGVVCRAEVVRPWTDRGWRLGDGRTLPRGCWLALAPTRAERTAEPRPISGTGPGTGEDGHALALGASGAGKTSFLAERAAAAIRGGRTVVALDLHGDLAPAIVGRLAPSERARVVAVDVTRRPVVGVAALAGSDERAAGQLVAAVKRLSPDGTEVYWGFRLERIFDAFVRLVQESGGSLLDLYALLTEADRRDAARLASRVPELRAFLDELGPIVRRNPEFLWPAAARLAKVVLVPSLTELLAPSDGGVPVEDLLRGGRSLLVRLPFAEVGPEAASFAASLVLARVYLGLAAGRGTPGSPIAPPFLVVLDEVQMLAPRLVAEMLAEGRKFGLHLLLASQFPERLAPELRAAAAGVSRSVHVFRTPLANAAALGAWIGLSAADAGDVLPGLPTGCAVVRTGGSGELRAVAGPRADGDEGLGWTAAVERTAGEFRPADLSADTHPDDGTERLLLAILAAEEQGRPLPAGTAVAAARELPGPPTDPVELEARAPTLGRRGLVAEAGGTLHLTAAGTRWLGVRTSTGASRESAEHRNLLVRAFRLFARRGYRLEIVRQGRFDTTLPDALFRQLPDGARQRSPGELAEAIAIAQGGWAWRCFRGRDVHVEVEVSGATRPERIRHGLAKARGRGAFVVFVVGDPRRAARVRRTLAGLGAGPDRAQVWTLGGPLAAEGTAPLDGKAPARSLPS